MKLSFLSSLLLLACSAGPTGPGITGDAGNQNGDSGTKPTGDKFGINASLGIGITDHPYASEWMTGSVLVSDANNKPLSGATFTANGVQLGEDSLLKGFYDGNDPINGPSAVPVMPGGMLTLVANGPTESATEVLQCPNDATITSPAEGATVAAGSTVNVTFTTGSLGQNLIFSDSVAIMPYDPIQNTSSGIASGAQMAKIAGAQRSANVVAPTGTSETGFVIELLLWGTDNLQGNNSGACTVSKRIHLVKQ